MAQIRWTPKAVEQLEKIIGYIAKDSEHYAKLTAREIFKRISLLKSNKHLGRIVPELNEHDIREIIYRRYRIVYKIRENVIEIWTIFHSSQDPDRFKIEITGK